LSEQGGDRTDRQDQARTKAGALLCYFDGGGRFATEIAFL